MIIKYISYINNLIYMINLYILNIYILKSLHIYHHSTQILSQPSVACKVKPKANSLALQGCNLKFQLHSSLSHLPGFQTALSSLPLLQSATLFLLLESCIIISQPASLSALLLTV